MANNKKEVRSDVIYYCNMQTSKKCSNKHGLLSSGDFYAASSNGIFNNGRTPICKDCLKEYVYNADGELDINKFKKVLMLIDYPFYQIEFESAMKDKKETIGVYIKNVQLNHKGVTWIDGEKDYSKTIINNEIIENVDFDITSEMRKFWGNGYAKEDYMFLEEYYHDLIRIYDYSLPVQVNNYRNMAKTQLQANKCLDNSDMNGYDKSMKILSMLSGDSNIKPVQENSTEKIAKGGFDMFVKHIEDDEPVPLWEKDLGFVDKFKYYLSIFFFGNLARALNITNPFKKEFEEEMQEYTVDTSVVEEEMENQVDFLDGK
jgi:hypothetical protein